MVSNRDIAEEGYRGKRGAMVELKSAVLLTFHATPPNQYISRKSSVYASWRIAHFVRAGRD